jgi:RNA polymerase sigma-70 factor (ECF subfamily)
MTDAQAAHQEEMIEHIPALRAFARSLAKDSSRADDLVQETILKAWSNINSFTAGTNMRAWLFTILRNTFYSDFRKARREVEDVDGKFAAQVPDKPAQDGVMEMRDFERAFAELPADQREALTLVGASGLTYEEAAEICDCAVGTIKSRVNRARVRLSEMLDMDDDNATVVPGVNPANI